MPTNLGASRIDKAYVGTQEVTTMYLGTEKVYPNTTKWERWSLKWPLATGGEAYFQFDTANEKLNWDGTLKASNDLGDVQEGDVVRYATIYRYCRLVENTQRLLRQYSPNVKPTPLRDAYIDTVEDIDENAYPADGIAGEYWYVRK